MKLDKYKLILIGIVLIGVILRFYKLSDDPPGLYIDEINIGYNADSILKTGKDEYGTRYPLYFRSYGDYKMPLYIYAVSGSIYVFGRNDFAVRFPSALAGSLAVLLMYFFVKKILELDGIKSISKKESISLLSAFLLAVTPWQLQFSRGGFENNLALFLFFLAVYLALCFFEKKKSAFLYLSYLFFILAVYTYNTFRFYSPIVVLVFSISFFLKFPKDRRKIIFPFVLFSIFMLPMVSFSLSGEGQARFIATYAFGEYRSLPLVKKLFLYPFVFLKNYTTYFSPYFLFATGDGIGRHQIPNFGPLFRWQLPFWVAGLYSLISLKRSYLKYLTIFLILLAPIPGSLTLPSPHTLRSLPLIIPLTIVISLGILLVVKKLGPRFKYLIGIVVIIGLMEFVLYLHFYYVIYPQVNALDWGSGYKEMVMAIDQAKNNYDKVVIDANLSPIAVYYHFYDETNPPMIVPVTWTKPKAWANKKVLYVRPYYGSDSGPNIVKNVYFKGLNHKIAAQFWKL